MITPIGTTASMKMDKFLTEACKMAKERECAVIVTLDGFVFEPLNGRGFTHIAIPPGPGKGRAGLNWYVRDDRSI